MKPIPSAPGCYATPEGQIIGTRGRPLSLFLRKGYFKCQAAGKQQLVNRMVCEAFHGPAPSLLHHAAHLDGDKQNNYFTNLMWKTSAENAADTAKHGIFKGERHPRAKLSEQDVIEIRRRFAAKESMTKIHSSYMFVCYATISHICHERNWNHDQ